jgi:hypothetical protein
MLQAFALIGRVGMAKSAEQPQAHDSPAEAGVSALAWGNPSARED